MRKRKIKRNLAITKKALKVSKSHAASEYELTRTRVTQIIEDLFARSPFCEFFAGKKYANFYAIQKDAEPLIDLIDAELMAIIEAEITELES